ncbi:type I secretion system permease/ATPase [Propylenella binzhouense]|nr:type I secretion system permease/ATPase [Propylenella binzhouense]
MSDRRTQRGRGAAENALDQAIRAMRPAFALMLAFSFCANLLKLTIPLYMLQIIDRVLSSGSEETLIYLTLIAGFALMIASVLIVVQRLVQNRLGQWFEDRLFQPVLTASLDGQLVGRSFGSQASRDLVQLRQFVSSPGLGTLLDAPWTPIFIIVAFILHPLIGLVSLSAAVILLVLAFLNDLLIRTRQNASQSQSGRLMQEIERGSHNAAIIHSMGLLESFLSRLAQIRSSIRDNEDRVNERNNLIAGCTRFIRQFAQVLTYAVGAYLVLESEVTSGIMIAGSILLSLALSPVDQSITAWRSTVNAWQARGRLRQQLSAVDARPELGYRAPRPEGHLVLQQALYMPPGRARPVLRPMSFEVRPGEMMGVLGPSSAGKSALLRMLMGVVPPTGGSVRLDNADIHRLVPADIGRHIGYLPQDPMLFHATIADNIARLEPATRDGRNKAIVEAAKMASIDTVILDLPERYETVVDDETLVLSRSERQRIALARAFYGRPKLVVLDEPAAFLDRTSETALIETLKQLRGEGSTIVLVTQRPTILEICDKLLLLRDGMIEAFGEPKAVMERLRDGGTARIERSGQQQRRIPLQAVSGPGGA